MERNYKAEAEFPLLKDLGDAIEQFDIICGNKVPKRDKPKTKVQDDLRWFDDDDLPFGWCAKWGYSLDWDDGCAQVWIHCMELNTGQRIVEFQPREIDPKQLQEMEARIAAEEEQAAQAQAEHLAERDYEARWEDE